MKKILTIASFGLLLGMGAQQALAMECTTAPEDQWMKPEQLRKMFTEQGYDVKKVKKEDSCLEVYAIKDGEKMEIIVDPTNGKVLKTKKM